MLKPVYALVGSDPFLQLQALLSLLQQADDPQRLDLDGERAELADVLDELRSFAMFGGSRIVVVRNADPFVTRFREQLENYVAHPSDSSTLVLRLNSLPSNQRIYKAIAKVGQIEKCDPPKDAARWIVSQARSAHKLNLTPDAARMLAELIGNDLGRLDSELAKLAIQSDSGRIDVADISSSISFQREQQMYDMTNELASGRPAEALKRWRKLVQLDSSAEFRAVTWLNMWLERVQKALDLRAAGMSPSAIARELRLWPPEFQTAFLNTAAALGPAGVAHAIDLLVEIDQQSKSGVGDAVSNVERFLLSVLRDA